MSAKPRPAPRHLRTPKEPPAIDSFFCAWASTFRAYRLIDSGSGESYSLKLHCRVAVLSDITKTHFSSQPAASLASVSSADGTVFVCIERSAHGSLTDLKGMQ